jgi:hypothetical protein
MPFAFTNKKKPLSVTEVKFTSVGVVRVTMQILDDRFLYEDLSSSSYITTEEGLKEAIREVNERYEKYRNLIE